MPAAADILDRGRESYGRHAWADAFASLSAADEAMRLDAADLVLLATAAYLVGTGTPKPPAHGRVRRSRGLLPQGQPRRREPQPALALLRLAQGQVDAAQAAIRRVVDEAEGFVARSQLLPGHVEVMLAAGDVDAAAAGADELACQAVPTTASIVRAPRARATETRWWPSRIA